MSLLRFRLVCGSCLAVVLVMGAYGAHAETPKREKPPVKLTTDIKAQATSENNIDLDRNNEGGSDSQLLELKSKLDARKGDFSALLEARWVENYGEGGSFDTETGETTGVKDFVELRQYWIGYDNIFGREGLGLRVGRQRIREDYGFWWNRDQDALRVFYDAQGVKGFIGVGENLTEYRSTGDAYNQDDQNILRVFGEVSKEWRPAQFIDGRFMVQHDHSDMEGASTLVKADDFDGEDADLVWLGLRVHGAIGAQDVQAEDERSKAMPAYRVDVAMVTGEEEDLTSTTGPGVFRTVTGHTDQDVFGWAFDAGVDVPVSVMGIAPILHAGYAYGSGDEGGAGGTDHAFRQTGLDGNSSRLGGFSAAIHNYGSVLRPDLSNLHIATLGVTVPLGEATDLAGYYRYYRLADEDGGISGSITAARNGEDTDLGHGLDLILNMDMAKQFGVQEDGPLDRINLRTTMGAFRAGEAYGTGEGETALRGQVDFAIRF